MGNRSILRRISPSNCCSLLLCIWI
uniref:Uncharacterized protein n=1 Tax=Arundo donax TaxID=35708 RepID=A0A0A9FSK5_ARUDO